MPSLPNKNSNNDKKTKIYTRENLGYVDGYAQYVSKSGGHWGPGIQEKKKIEKTGVDASKRDGARLSWMFDKHSNIFKKILLGYDNSKISKSDSYEDPTYLIFDVEIDTEHSPLFSKYVDDNSISSFSTKYWENIPEISERLDLGGNETQNMISEFQNQFLKLFQTTTPNSTDYLDNGIKQYYIESISGLDVLNKKIINYPEDFIVFTMSEDITLLAQYITELYNNLTYSYDTHRQLIPDNLLRFNMKITLSDFRNMRAETNKMLSIMYSDSSIDTLQDYQDMINSYKSKMIYVLHDCQLNFFDSKSFGNDMSRGGFGVAKPNEVAKNTFKINFKSVSKIMAPLFIDNSFIIDLRERDLLQKDNYKTNYDRADISDEIIIEKNGTKKRKFMDKVKGAIKSEVTEVRNIIVNQLKQEVGDLASRANDWIAQKTGMSAVKLNVYQDTPAQKLGQINVKITNYIDKKAGELLGNDKKKTAGLKEKTGNIYRQQPQNSTVTRQRSNTGNTITYKTDVYDNWHEKDGVHYPSYNQKYPNADTSWITDVHPDGTYNEKYPVGDVHPDGTYNEKYPIGDVQPDGKYNQKYPVGDVHPDGTYHDKEPNGDVHPDGKYNMKYPNGDVHPDGTYNEKYPKGDVHPDGTYNEKYPDGTVQPKGNYNQKYPEGTVQPNGIYNEKYPKGDIQPDGTYNEKHPNGNVQPKGTYNEKYPNGDVQPDGSYNTKYPKGDIQPDGTYNEKYPDGTVQPKGEYNDKKPHGDVHPDGTYHDKEPEGRVEPKGKYHDKQPDERDVMIKGTPIYKYPNGNVYKK